MIVRTFATWNICPHALKNTISNFVHTTCFARSTASEDLLSGLISQHDQDSILKVQRVTTDEMTPAIAVRFNLPEIPSKVEDPMDRSALIEQ